LADEQSIRCVLPVTPLSYHGRLISVQWCVRMRLFLANGREIVAEQPFYLVSEKMAVPHSVEAIKSPLSLPQSTDSRNEKVVDHSSAS